MILKCKMCGGDLNIELGAAICECEFCGTMQTIPAVDNEKKGNLFNRANRLRMASEFDKAAAVYESIVAEFPEEAEAYWGLCLCAYGIEYVDDPATGKKMPTCHRTRQISIMDENNFDMACEYADGVARKLYREEAKEIDRLQRAILEIVAGEEPYDVFICYKETDEDGSRTEDSVLAQDMYDALTEKGLKVFFARITLEDKLGQQYEPYIYAALHSAKVMLAVGTSFEHYDAVWVKNEWSRFLAMGKEDHHKTLIPCFKGIDAYDIPREFRNLQAQDMGKLGWLQDLTRGVMKLCGKDQMPVQYARAVMPGQMAVHAANAAPLTDRGYIYLEDGDFDQATGYFDRALDENPMDARAYLGKFLASIRLSSLAEANKKEIDLSAFKDFDRALRFSEGDMRKNLQAFADGIREKKERTEACRRLLQCMKGCLVRKRGEEDLEKVIGLLNQGTVAAYDQAIDIYTRNYWKKTHENYTEYGLSAMKIQRRILHLLENSSQFIHVDQMIDAVDGDAGLVKEQLEKLHALQLIDRAPGNDAFYGRKDMAMKLAYQESKVHFERAAVEKIPAHAAAYYRLAADALRIVTGYKDADEKREECLRLAREWDEKAQNWADHEKDNVARWRTVWDRRREAMREKMAALSQQMETTEKQMQEQLAIYTANEHKLLGEGARLKRVAMNEYTRLNARQEELKKACLQEEEQSKDGKKALAMFEEVLSISQSGTRSGYYWAFNRYYFSIPLLSYQYGGTFDQMMAQERRMASLLSKKIGAGLYAMALTRTGFLHETGLRTTGVLRIPRQDLAAVACGEYHSLVLRKGGRVSAESYGAHGQGDVDKWRGITAIAVSGHRSFGLTEQHTVVAAGLNENGECNVDKWQDIIEISAGKNHTVGLKSDGTVVAAGSNQYGQCNVGDWNDIVAVAAGEAHTVGLKSDGTVVAVGSNDLAQCCVDHWQGIIAIAANQHTVGLRADGTVIAVGGRGRGECNVGSWRDMLAITAGRGVTMGITAAGTVAIACDPEYHSQPCASWTLF